MSKFKHFPLLLFISLSCISLALAFVKGDKYDESTFSKINGNKEKINSGVPKELSKKSPFRLSAVGIIMLILTIILSGIFIYYFFLFYPILCRKERNYDVVEHSRDTTPTPLPTPNPENAP